MQKICRKKPKVDQYMNKDVIMVQPVIAADKPLSLVLFFYCHPQRCKERDLRFSSITVISGGESIRI